MKILFSILITNFNKSNYLKKTIESCLKQSNYKNIEILVFDDCSTDKSNYVAKSLSKNSNQTKFKILKLTERGGQTGAYKKAFKITCWKAFKKPLKQPLKSR